MRWPSFFGRAAAEKGPRTPEARPTGREWASLPAIQRAVGEPELTAPTAAFVGSLAGTHDPDLSLEPLGHNVSLDGPSGLVIGLVRSVDTYSPSSELVGRPRARRDTTVQRRIVDAEETSAPAAVEYAGRTHSPSRRGCRSPPSTSPCPRAPRSPAWPGPRRAPSQDRKSTRLNPRHSQKSYA